VREVDLDAARCGSSRRAGESGPLTIPYDTLDRARGGFAKSYFAQRRMEAYAHEVKSARERLAGGQILSAFEGRRARDGTRAPASLAHLRRGRLGDSVEMAGQIGELARDTLRARLREMASAQWARPAASSMADARVDHLSALAFEQGARLAREPRVTPLLSHTSSNSTTKAVRSRQHDGRSAFPRAP